MQFAGCESLSIFLLKSVCIPILTYALEVIPLLSSEISKLDFYINSCLFKIFGQCSLDTFHEIKVGFKIPVIRELTVKRNEAYVHNNRKSLLLLLVSNYNYGVEL